MIPFFAVEKNKQQKKLTCVQYIISTFSLLETTNYTHVLEGLLAGIDLSNASPGMLRLLHDTLREGYDHKMVSFIFVSISYRFFVFLPGHTH